MDTRKESKAYICVFCGASEKAAQKYATQVNELVIYMANHDCGLIFGLLEMSNMGDNVLWTI